MSDSDGLRDALARVTRLVIEHPDPDQYDTTWNDAIHYAVAEIRGVIHARRRKVEQKLYRTLEDIEL